MNIVPLKPHELTLYDRYDIKAFITDHGMGIDDPHPIGQHLPTIVARDNHDQIIGVVHHKYLNPYTVQLDLILVDHDHRGTGIGEQLMTAFLDAFRQHQYLDAIICAPGVDDFANYSKYRQFTQFLSTHGFHRIHYSENSSMWMYTDTVDDDD